MFSSILIIFNAEKCTCSLKALFSIAQFNVVFVEKSTAPSKIDLENDPEIEIWQWQPPASITVQ